ncbi:hypothetical protein P1J78_06665 [Psychromarinibacter sp. C21-152]|uniref:Uncharacterized protein n=1 Tax=Psychromarinibacter sediminicola TaxID=3033385 RepID=A0AAE3NQY7_9RHOB|nr:hypothetical protein [Psychromarinibacter sediminicola]MDF0600406.1 hypothetical protein [Psychromarinibacter sediminicola]
MRLTVACLLAALPAAALAEEFGTVTVDMGGEARTFYTITAESGGETAATAEFGKQSMFTTLHIQAHPAPRFTATDVISLDLMWMGDFAPGKAPNSVELIHMPDGMNGPIWTNEGAPQPIATDLEIDLEGGTVRGSFGGPLCIRESIAAETDTGTCMEVSGTVESGLLVQ